MNIQEKLFGFKTKMGLVLLINCFKDCKKNGKTPISNLVNPTCFIFFQIAKFANRCIELYSFRYSLIKSFSNLSEALAGCSIDFTTNVQCYSRLKLTSIF